MSRTRRIYNRKPWLYQLRWFGSSIRAMRLMMQTDPEWSFTFWKSCCMGRCKSCRKAWQKEWNGDQAIKYRNAMESLTVWGL